MGRNKVHNCAGRKCKCIYIFFKKIKISQSSYEKKSEISQKRWWKIQRVVRMK